MEKKYYKILWIDDEHEGMKGFKGDAKFHEIQLVSYKSRNEGLSELKKNYPIYDGVLLDAKFFENEDDVKGSEDTFNVHRVKEELLKLPKKFEVFVLTGQAEAFEDKTFNQAFTKVYKKANDDDVERLFNDIKQAADQLEDTQIRHKYNRVFDVCTERYIGETAAHEFLDLLLYNGCESDKLNQLRKIIEDLFIAFNKYDLLPTEFIKPYVAISPTSKFLCGIDQSERTTEIYKKFKLNDESILPDVIRYYLRNITHITQSGSHRSYVDTHINNLKTPYLYQSVLYQLLDVVVWFKQYIDSKPKAKNWVNLLPKAESQMLEYIDGEVIQRDNLASQGKDYAFFKPSVDGDNVLIPSHLVSDNSLSDNMNIRVQIEEYTDNRTGELKRRVKNVEKI